MQSFKEFLEEQTKPILMSDVDGILLDFTKGFTAWLAINQPRHKVDKTVWDFGLGDQARAAVDEFWASKEFGELEFYRGAKAGINKLSKIFEVHIVTAADPKYKRERISNLSGVKYKSIKIIKHGKVTYIINSLKPLVAIEDKPSNVKKMAKAGIEVYFPKLPLTKVITENENTIKFQNWNHLVSMLEKKYGM